MLRFLLSLFRGLRRCFSNLFLSRVDNGIRIQPRRKHNLQFIPEPLPGGRKIEVVAFDGKTIREGYAAAGRMAGIGPVPRFEQYSVEHPELDYFAGHAVDFHPIAEANAIFPHQHEPPQETHDEVFQRDGKASPSQAPKCSNLSRRAKDTQEK